jgi:hypothetical protein
VPLVSRFAFVRPLIHAVVAVVGNSHELRVPGFVLASIVY